MADTLLAITGLGLAPFSARGLTQTLEPIEQASNVRRDINGGLHDQSATQFQKYKSSISCSDINSVSFDDNWPGKSVVVDCVPELSYVTAGGTPGRTVVAGSSRTDGAYTFYRPQLTMLVTNWNVSRDEYGHATGWTLELEEI